ncbi:YutD family protein [Lactobacillus psittaci]|uniref:Transcriptional regulator n=1 Tax=Lactobacillus psittaci DSM 15354 TaxID=1122152 RepID=A0A0R1S3C3_9LACO|nr:YutD family protein [Lactobacillus psittaci]KRL63038.1 hypothetical protein FC23_GL000975 [Lactobacillus psittaci DSM 15354]
MENEQASSIHHALAEVTRLGDDVYINNRHYKLLKEVNGEIDLDLLRQKYDPYLDQYDFLVGDVSSEHLRLKGFFNDWVRTSIDKKIATVVDYLTEYCNPGSSYFILELAEDNSENERIESYRHKNNKRKQNNYRSNKKENYKYRERKVKKTKFRPKKNYAQTKKGGRHVFVIKKRRDK